MQRLEIKASFTGDPAQGEIEGLAAIYGTADRVLDVIQRGAFSEVKLPLPMLASHDPADVVGVWDAVEEAPEGLRVKGRLLVDDVARAREVRALIMAKAMTGLSIGYVARKSAPRKGGGRDLQKVEVLEVSIVAVPCHPQARVEAVKMEGNTMTKENEGGGGDGEVKTLVAAEVKAFAPDAIAAAVAPFIARLDEVEKKAGRAIAQAGTAAGQEATPERKAFAAYLSRGHLIGAEEQKALTLSSDPSGGYLAPPEISAEILRDLVEFSPLRQYASVASTSAPSVIYPTRKPFGNATWDDPEADDETETTDTDFLGSREVPLNGMSTFVDISNQLMQDAPQVENEVRAALAEDFAKKESVAFVSGNGIKRPEGLMTNAEIAKFKNGHATTLAQDALVKLLYSMPATYRNRGVWMMNGTTLGVVRTMKDGQNNYLWQPSYQAGQPETILGRPVVEVLDMPDIASGACPIIYGDAKGYRIVDRLVMSILVDPYSRAVQKQTRFHATRRVGGRVLYPAYFKKLEMAV